MSVIERIVKIPPLSEKFLCFIENIKELFCLRNINCYLRDNIFENLRKLTIDFCDLVHISQYPFLCLHDLVISRDGYLEQNISPKLRIQMKNFPKLKIFQCTSTILEELYIENSIELTQLTLNCNYECLRYIQFSSSRLTHFLCNTTSDLSELDIKAKNLEIFYMIVNLIKHCKTLVELELQAFYVSYPMCSVILSDKPHLLKLLLNQIIVSSIDINAEECIRLVLPFSLEKCSLDIPNKIKAVEIVYGNELESMYLSTNAQDMSLICQSEDEMNNSLITTTNSSSSQQFPQSLLKNLQIDASDTCIQKLWYKLNQAAWRPNLLESLDLYSTLTNNEIFETMFISNFPNLTYVRCPALVSTKNLILYNLPKLQIFDEIKDYYIFYKDRPPITFSEIHSLKKLVLKNHSNITLENMHSLLFLEIVHQKELTLTLNFQLLPSLHTLHIPTVPFFSHESNTKTIRCPNLQNLECRMPTDKKSVESMIQFLGECQQLKSILFTKYFSIRCTQFETLLNKTLGKLSNLQVLNFGTIWVKQICLVSGFQQLQQLKIKSSTNNASIQIENLARLSLLQVYSMPTLLKKDSCIKLTVRSLPMLKTIDCCAQILAFENLPHLQTLNIHNDDAKFFIGKNLISLTYLELSASNLIHIEHFPKLEKANIGGRSSESTTLNLIQVPKLEKLFLNDIDVFGSNSNIDINSCCHNLKTFQCVFIPHFRQIQKWIQFLLQCVVLTKVKFISSLEDDYAVHKQLEEFTQILTKNLSSHPSLRKISFKDF